MIIKDLLSILFSLIGISIGSALLYLTWPEIKNAFKEKECDCEARAHGCKGNDKDCPYNGYWRKHDPCYKCQNNPSEKCENCPTRIEYKIMTDKNYPQKLEIHGDDCGDCEERFSCTGNCKYIQEVERCDKN